MMTDADGLLAARFAATRDLHDDGNWSDVVRRTQARRPTRRRTLMIAVAVGVVVVVVALATPLGAAIVDKVGGFSAWLTGQPGKPASKAEQRAFDQANAHSWLGFPAGTRLRHLITSGLPNGRIVELLGFRSGDGLCLQVVVSGKSRAATTSCAPLAELRASNAPVHVVLADMGFGKGTKHAWYGIDRFGAPSVQVTAGIAADGVKQVIVEDQLGRHAVPAKSNAFLYVATSPDVGQRVKRIWARTTTGLVAVPFAPALFGVGDGGAGERSSIAGPSQVERRVHDGTIGWLDRHEPRGQPLDVLPLRDRAIAERHAVVGRVLTPDPGLPIRLAVTLSTSRHGGRAIGLCSWLIQHGGIAGGCAVRAQLFAETPLTADMSLLSGSDEFERVSGLASDDVSRIEIFLARGSAIDAPLADNAYVVAVPRGHMPFRLVAYDSSDRVIGILNSPSGAEAEPGPTRGRARPLLRAVSSDGATAVLSVGASTAGGTCAYVRYDTNTANGVGVSCRDATKSGRALLLESLGNPTQFVAGRVRDDVVKVELRFADGARVIVKPTRGFLLYGVPAQHVRSGRQLVRADARDASGRRIGSESFDRSTG